MSARAGNGAAASPAVASKGKKRAAKVMLASKEARPVVVKPERLALRLDERRAHAPHTLARKAGKSCAMDICEAAPAAEPAGGWETKVLMPAEAKEEDLGWKPGPRLATVKVPTFSGKPCGINKELFPKLTADSSAFDFMETQITRENKIEIMNLTANAMDNYFLLQKTRGVKVTGKYKLSLEPDFLRDNPDAFDCWLAARLLIGQYAMSVPQKELWRPKGSHCHARLVGCLRRDQYCCLNKFLTLSDEDGKLLTEEDAKAIVAAEKEKAAAVPGAGGGAGGSCAGTPASHAAGGGGGGGGGTTNDDDDDDDEGEGEDEVRAIRGNQAIYRIPVPEPCWSYNIFGRSGTDGHDQLRKDGKCDARRTLRDGIKGGCFTFDTCVVNGYAMKRHEKKGLTKLQFTDDYIVHVLTTMTLRKYKTKYASGDQTLSDAITGGEHKLVCPQKTVVQAWEKAPGVPKHKRRTGEKYIHKRGTCKHCSTVGTDVTGHKTAITTWRCNDADCECWCHPDCFFQLAEHQ